MAANMPGAILSAGAADAQGYLVPRPPLRGLVWLNVFRGKRIPGYKHWRPWLPSPPAPSKLPSATLDPRTRHTRRLGGNYLGTPFKATMVTSQSSKDV
eukprot:2198128-Alexandrium_andersonii.AAC.1